MSNKFEIRDIARELYRGNIEKFSGGAINEKEGTDMVTNAILDSNSYYYIIIIICILFKKFLIKQLDLKKKLNPGESNLILLKAAYSFIHTNVPKRMLIL